MCSLQQLRSLGRVKPSHWHGACSNSSRATSVMLLHVGRPPLLARQLIPPRPQRLQQKQLQLPRPLPPQKQLRRHRLKQLLKRRAVLTLLRLHRLQRYLSLLLSAKRCERRRRMLARLLRLLFPLLRRSGSRPTSK